MKTAELAKAIVVNFGMSDLGAAAAVGDADDAVRAELRRAEDAARDLVRDHDRTLRSVARALVKRETLDGAALGALFAEDGAPRASKTTQARCVERQPPSITLIKCDRGASTACLACRTRTASFRLVLTPELQKKRRHSGSTRMESGARAATVEARQAAVAPMASTTGLSGKSRDHLAACLLYTSPSPRDRG